MEKIKCDKENTGQTQSMWRDFYSTVFNGDAYKYGTESRHNKEKYPLVWFPLKEICAECKTEQPANQKTKKGMETLAADGPDD